MIGKVAVRRVGGYDPGPPDQSDIGRLNRQRVQIVNFTIPGAPRTKKNHGRVIQRGRRKFHVQSKAHEAWHTVAMWHLSEIKAWMLIRRFILPIERPVHVRAGFYRDRNVGDLVGYQQALGDLLQDAGIIADDKLIESWDGTRLDKDSKNPRIFVEIFEMEK